MITDAPSQSDLIAALHLESLFNVGQTSTIKAIARHTSNPRSIIQMSTTRFSYAIA
jgi:hypothetical protein